MRARGSRRRGRVGVVLVFTIVVAACSTGPENVALSQEPLVEVVAQGLINPVGLAELDGGAILVAEEGTGRDDTSAGVSIIMPDGRVGRIVSGLASGTDAGDLSGTPLVGVSPNGATAFTSNFGAEGLLTFEVPAGGFEPLAKQDVLGPEELTFTMTALNEVRLTNAFDVTFDAEGRPVVTDASQNGVATVNSDGTVRFIHRFGELNDPRQPSLRIDAVPTGITALGDEYLVTLTGGCPFPADAGRLVAIDGDRSERVVVDGLSMPIDVALGSDGAIWLLEFARFTEGASCFTGEGYQPGTGRLSLVMDGTTKTVLDGLDFPGAVLVAADGSVYISEVFSGRVLRLSWGDEVVAGGPIENGPVDRTFRDVAAPLGIDFRQGAFISEPVEDPVAMMGGGLCWVDYDADGWLDLYFVNSYATSEAEQWENDGGLPTNSLYRNLGGEFANVSAETGTDLAIRGNGCVAADFDGDGWVDIYVTADGPNQLLRNRGNGTFELLADAAGAAAGDEWSTAAAVADVDLDGDLDLFVGTYIDLERKIERPSGAFPQDFVGLANRLFLNTGQGLKFVEATGVGLDRSSRTLGALFTDLDFDGDLDLYVANDGEPNRLYRNDSDGSVRFSEITEEAGTGDSGSGMGVAGGDYDADGRLDLFVSNWEAELDALYRNETEGTGSLRFGYETYGIGLAGLGNNTTGWGTAWVDFDLDTDLDLLVVRGRVPVTDLGSDPELARLYANQTADGRPGQFLDWTDQSGFTDVGPMLARGSAVADFDNDGDMDIAVNNIAGPPALLRNEGTSGNWLVVTIPGALPGTMVSVELSDGTTLLREFQIGSSYLASEDPRFHFGLGEDEILTLVVTQPGREQIGRASCRERV